MGRAVGQAPRQSANSVPSTDCPTAFLGERAHQDRRKRCLYRLERGFSTSRLNLKCGRGNRAMYGRFIAAEKFSRRSRPATTSQQGRYRSFKSHFRQPPAVELHVRHDIQQSGVADQPRLGPAIPLSWKQLRRKSCVMKKAAMGSVWLQKEDKSLCSRDGADH